MTQLFIDKRTYMRKFNNSICTSDDIRKIKGNDRLVYTK